MKFRLTIHGLEFGVWSAPLFYIILGVLLS
jgi:hypothetical protein